MDHLEPDHDVARRLNDLNAVVVVEREHRRRQPARDAAIPGVEVRRLVEYFAAPTAAHLRSQLFAFVGELGETAIGRLAHQRRETCRLVVVARLGPMAHAHLVALDLVLVTLVARRERLLSLRVLLVRKIQPVSVLRIALKWRADQIDDGPHALNVGIAPGRLRLFPSAALRRR